MSEISRTPEMPHLKSYMVFLQLERTLSENTAVSYRFDLQRLAAYLRQHSALDLQKVTPEILSAHIRLLYDLGFAPTSIQRTVSSIKSYFAFAAFEGYISAG